MGVLQASILAFAVIFYSMFTVGPSAQDFVEALNKGHSVRGAARKAGDTFLIGAWIATASTGFCSLILVFIDLAGGLT